MPFAPSVSNEEDLLLSDLDDDERAERVAGSLLDEMQNSARHYKKHNHHKVKSSLQMRPSPTPQKDDVQSEPTPSAEKPVQSPMPGMNSSR